MEWHDHSQGAVHEPKPAAHQSWAIASSQDVVSRIHIDTCGLATASVVLTGKKFWVVGDPLPVGSQRSSPDSVRAYEKFDSAEPDKFLRWEGVTLRPGNVL